MAGENNELNKFFRGAIGGGQNAALGLIEQGKKNQANEDFTTAKNEIGESWKRMLASQEAILEAARNELGITPKKDAPVVPVTNPDGSVSDFQAGTVDGQTPPVQKEIRDPKQLYLDMIDAYTEGKKNLGNNPYGANNSQALDMYMNLVNKEKKQPDVKYHFGPNGEIIRYTDNPNDAPMEIKKGKDKEQKQEFGLPSGSFMDKDAEGNIKWYGVKRDANGNVEKYELGIAPTEQDLKDYADGLTDPEKTGGRRKYGGLGGSLPKTDISGADARTISNLKKLAELKSMSAGNWEDFYFEKDKFGNVNKEKVSAKGKEWDDLQRQLKNDLPGVDLDQAAIEIDQKTFKKKGKKYDENNFVQDEKAKGKTYSELKGWKEKIKDMWGRYALDESDPNNNALLWLNEMDKHGWLSDPNVSIDSLKRFFQETTGRKLEDYVDIK